MKSGIKHGCQEVITREDSGNWNSTTCHLQCSACIHRRKCDNMILQCCYRHHVAIGQMMEVAGMSISAWGTWEKYGNCHLIIFADGWLSILILNLKLEKLSGRVWGGKRLYHQQIFNLLNLFNSHRVRFYIDSHMAEESSSLVAGDLITFNLYNKLILPY